MSGVPPLILELFKERHSYWRKLAACRTMPTETFFPGRGDRAGVAAAKEVCQRCPALVPCREYSLQTNPPWGILGGLTEGERRRLRRERREQVAS